MLDNSTRESVMTDLQQVIATCSLTAAAKQQANRLLKRLQTGVRVIVLGPRGVGKSQLCSVLLNQFLPNEGNELHRSYKHAAACAETDTCRHTAIAHPLLETITLTDVNGGNSADWEANLREAMDQADVVVWCTQEFSAVELAIWQEASEHLKDHSLLVLTKADQHGETGDLSLHINALQAIAAEEFHSFFPTSTFQTCEVLKTKGVIHETELAKSGVKALAQALSNIAASGQRADLDSTLLFLERHRAQPSSSNDGSKAQNPKQSASAPAYEQALELLKSRLPEATALSDGVLVHDAEAVLACCGAIAEGLVAVADEALANEPSFDAWRDDLSEASDKVVLMGLEGNLKSAADAAAVILQLKQDLECRVLG
ncbi:GTPase domain-containing protein [Roseobacter sp.]|uniref:GTPase domain-containing protein n=1 Tax=Roseobacter sp. TaxID=1907202 RepID=UPI00385CA96F